MNDCIASQRAVGGTYNGGRRFGFEVYNYAGGFDDEATHLFKEVHECFTDFEANEE